MASNKNLVIFSIAVVVLLVLAVGYIGYNIYSQAKIQKEVSVFQQGVQYGQEQIIRYIVQQAGPGSCQQVPLNIENQTINIIAVECLTAQT